jgi:hypothetical protein
MKNKNQLGRDHWKRGARVHPQGGDIPHRHGRGGWEAPIDAFVVPSASSMLGSEEDNISIFVLILDTSQTYL